MLIPKKNRVAIYSKLFEDGVLCAKKNVFDPKHHEITDVPNLHVMMLLRSLKSKGYVTEHFNWQWFYWTLSNEGIIYLREYLHLPEEINPDTLEPKQIKAQPRPFDRDNDRERRPFAGRGARRERDGDRDGYRK